MKTAACTLLSSILMVGAVHAQQPAPAPPPAAEEKSETKLGAFLATKGRMLLKDFYALGQVGTVTFDAVVISEPGRETSKIRGLRVEISETGRFAKSHTSFLDAEEAESLLVALAYMQKLGAEWLAAGGRVPYSEVSFTTKGDFEIGFYYKNGKLGVVTSSGKIGKAAAFLDMSDLPKIAAIIQQGLTKLRES